MKYINIINGRILHKRNINDFADWRACEWWDEAQKKVVHLSVPDVPPKFRNWNGSICTEMNQAEKDAVLAAEDAAAFQNIDPSIVIKNIYEKFEDKTFITDLMDEFSSFGNCIYARNWVAADFVIDKALGKNKLTSAQAALVKAEYPNG